MAGDSCSSRKLANCLHRLLFLCFALVHFLNNSSLIHALTIGVETTQSVNSMEKRCSKACESAFCTVPPFLRYGKYCGLLYSGCPEEKPCDGLDACCMKHDACIGTKNDYLSWECNHALLDCMAPIKNSSVVRTFKGNKCKVEEVVDIISIVMEAALLTRRTLHTP